MILASKAESPKKSRRSRSLLR